MPVARIDPPVELFYEDHYFGPPWEKPETILFVHGVAESSLSWFAWVPLLSAKYRLIRVDLRGFGRSTVPPPGSAWSISGFASDLAKLLDYIGEARVHVVAAKLGGTIAMQFAADHPQRVRTLSVFSSPVRGLSHTGDPKLLAGVSLLSTQGLRPWAEGTQRMRLGSRAPEDHIKFWNDYMASSNRDVCVEVEEMAGTMDITRDLPRIQAPTEVFTTGGSTMQSTRAVEEWVKLIPRGELVTLEGDGYHPAVVQPEICAQAVARFIARHSRERAR